ncbi:trypsin-like serine peptidase [Streptomyces sp. NPDC090106]|uniref:trypsin-like serine peptidase n=1 Tax=Streptomyces sp. NPDC090106 TaxID=3365946 RepID=UPI00380EF05A
MKWYDGAAGRPFSILLWASVLLFVLTGCQSTSPQTSRSMGEFTEPETWSSSDMADAVPYDMPLPDKADIDPRVSDPEPEAVPARPEQAPYVENAAVLGKVFFDTPKGHRVCSGTAVTDPADPGASSLVWTAGHCVHTGRSGAFYRNIVFVPSFNNEALSTAGGTATDTREISPLGVWWADRAAVSTGWAREGEEIGGAGAAYDYAVLHVRRADAPAQSLQDAIGYTVPVALDAPAITGIPTLKIWGYPAEAPFDGNLLFSCQDRPGRLNIAEQDPTLYRIGCTMNGGASGGGWFIGRDDGTLALVSNTSVGPQRAQWLAGPRLGTEAKKLLAAVGAAADTPTG